VAPGAGVARVEPVTQATMAEPAVQGTRAEQAVQDAMVVRPPWAYALSKYIPLCSTEERNSYGFGTT